MDRAFKFFLERGANLESRAAYTHPKYTQVSPPGPIYASEAHLTTQSSCRAKCSSQAQMETTCL